MLIFVEAGIAGTGLSCLQWAQESGLDIALVTSNPEIYRHVPGGDLLAELDRDGRVFRAADTDGETLDADLVEWARASATPTGVVCVGDRNLPFAARLAEALEVPFPSFEAVATFRDKRAARRLYEELDILSPRWTPVGTVADAERLLTETGTPVVLKNVKGAGSLDVLLCRTIDEIRANHATLVGGERYLGGELMAEEFVTGPLLSVETVISEGEVTHIGVTDRQLGPRPNFCELSYTFPVQVPDTARAEMERAIDACVAHFGMTHGFLHSEFILTERGPVMVEINARLGGGLLALMMNDCLTVSTWETLCRIALGQPIRKPEHNGRYASAVTVYSETAGTLEAINNPDEVASSPFVVDVVWNAFPGDQVSPPNDYRGSLCQIRTLADSPNVSYNAALAASRDVSARISSDAQVAVGGGSTPSAGRPSADMAAA